MSRLGSLENNFRLRTMHDNQDELIRYERALINRNNKSVRVQKVAPGRSSDAYPRLRRQYNKYGSKPGLTPGYVMKNDGSMSPNPRLRMVRGRYSTQRQCLYVPKKALMKMAKDMGVPGFEKATDVDMKKGSRLWKRYRTGDICEMLRNDYISKRRSPISGMSAFDDPRLREVRESLEDVAVRLRVPIVTKDGKSKSMFRLAAEIKQQLRAPR